MAGKINELVTDEALAKLDKLIADLAIANRSMADAIQLANQYTAAIGGSKNLAEFVKNQEKAAAAIKKVQEKIDETRVAEQNLSEERVKLTAKQIANEKRLQEIAEKRKRVVSEGTASEIAARKAQIAEEERLVGAIVKGTAATQANTTATNNLTTAELKSEQVAAQLKAQRLAAAAATTESTIATQAATQAVIANETATKSAAANIGSSLTRGLGYLRTLAYIIPGLGIAGIFNLAFEAISAVVSKLDIFSSKINTAAENLRNFNEVQKNASKEYGEQVTKLDILYRAATDVNNSDKKRLESVLALKKEFPETFGNLSKEAILNGQSAKAYDITTDAIIANAKARAAASKIAELAAKIFEADIQNQKIEIANINERNKLEKDAFDKTVDAFRFEQKRKGLSTELTQEQLRNLKKVSDASIVYATYESNVAAQNALKKSNDLKKSLNEQIEFIKKVGGGNNVIADVIDESDGGDGGKQANTEALENIRARLAQEKAFAKEVLDDSNRSYEDRLAALKIYIDKSNKLIDTELKIADAAPGISATKKDTNKVNSETSKSELKTEGINQEDKINAERIANEKKAAKDILDEYEALEKRKENIIQEGVNQQLLDSEYANSEEILQLTQKYSKGEVAEKEYRRRLKALQKDSAAEAVDIQIKALEEILEAQEAANMQADELGIKFNVDTQPTKNNITKLKIKRNQLKTGSDSDNALGDKAKSKQDAEEILATSALAIQGLNIIGDLIKANAQAKIDALEREFDLIQRNGESEKERINGSLLSNKEKARQTALIDAQTAQQRARITREENEIKKKQAQYDKANAIANIIQNTAVAYVKVLGQTGIFGLALAPVVAALGAAQLALAIATPLPQFYKGTKNAPEGFAHVGERGTELQINPDGTMGLTPNKDTITYLQRGTQIIPHDELMAMVAKPESVQYVGGMQMDNKKLEKLMEENNELQKRKPATVVKVIADKWGTYANRNY